MFALKSCLIELISTAKEFEPMIALSSMSFAASRASMILNIATLLRLRLPLIFRL